MVGSLEVLSQVSRTAFQVNKLHPTVASKSLLVYKTRFMPKKMMPVPTYTEYNKYIKPLRDNLSPT